MLHLEFFCSGNLTHFHIEWRKTNWNAIVYEQSRKCQNVHLTHAWLGVPDICCFCLIFKGAFTLARFRAKLAHLVMKKKIILLAKRASLMRNRM